MCGLDGIPAMQAEELDDDVFGYNQNAGNAADSPSQELCANSLIAWTGTLTLPSLSVACLHFPAQPAAASHHGAGCRNLRLAGKVRATQASYPTDLCADPHDPTLPGAVL